MRPSPSLAAGGLLVAAVAALCIPPFEPSPPAPAAGRPFAWSSDERWRALEARFRAARAEGCATLAPRVDAMLGEGRRLLADVAAAPGPSAPALDAIERVAFELGPLVAACPARLDDYVAFAARMRSAVKEASRRWDVGAPDARERLYRLLYGARAAVEEAMLQAPAGAVPALARGDDEPSATPWAEVRGVRVHSGDILLSRGDAPTSALIARGNDYPGNFSHVAIAVVEGPSGRASAVEAHIERGVAIADVPAYLADVKLRIMVLRLRHDLPRMAADPMLPHEAASFALARARARHIPYDFRMDFTDHAAMFCSEVASAAYEPFGVRLWMGLSHISSPGVVRWLAGFGVTHFETQEPSDLEYDPQLVVVAEWRDPQALLADHLDNAVVDAMLEDAERGEALTFPWYQLPVARIAKLASAASNLVGRVGPVPEGLSAAAALRNVAFSQRHAEVKARLVRLADEFRRREGYRPPYWTLVGLAREARAELRRP